MVKTETSSKIVRVKISSLLSFHC